MNKKLVIGVFATMLICVAVLVLVFVFKKNNETKFSYDISSFHEVTMTDVLGMFEDKKTHVVMIGYKECEVCAALIPYMKKAQIENNFITQYLDIEKMDRTSEEWYELGDKLDMITEQVKPDGSEVEKNTYGYFLHHYGYTPTIIIIKDGKQTGGHIGEASEKDLLNWLKDKVN